MKKLSDSKYRLTEFAGGIISGSGVFVLIVAGFVGYDIFNGNPDDLPTFKLLYIILSGFLLIGLGELITVFIEIAVNTRILAQKVLDENPDE